MNSAAIVQKHWNYWNVLHARGGPAPGLRVGEASELRVDLSASLEGGVLSVRSLPGVADDAASPADDA